MQAKNLIDVLASPEMRRFITLPEKEQNELVGIFNSLPDTLQKFVTPDRLDGWTYNVSDPKEIVKTIRYKLAKEDVILRLTKTLRETGSCNYMFESGASFTLRFKETIKHGLSSTSPVHPGTYDVGKITVVLTVGSAKIHAMYSGPAVDVSWVDWIIPQLVDKTLHLDAITDKAILKAGFDEATFNDILERAITKNVSIETAMALA